MAAVLTGTLGFFEQEGIPVVVTTLANTSRAMEALVSGSADVGTVSYPQIMQMAADGRDIRSFVLLAERFAAAIAVAPGHPQIRTIRDLKGRTVGVSGLGSVTHQFLNHVLTLNGLKPEDVSTAGVGVGRSAIAAFERGMVDAAVLSSGEHFRMKAKFPALVVLADAATREGSMAIFGSEFYPSAVLAARGEWLQAHPDQARRLARALKRTLVWLQAHSAEEIRERMPAEFRSDDVKGDIESLRMIKALNSSTGIMPHSGAEAVLKSLSGTQDQIRKATIDLSKTYTNEFVLEKQ